MGVPLKAGGCTCWTWDPWDPKPWVPWGFRFRCHGPAKAEAEAEAAEATKSKLAAHRQNCRNAVLGFRPPMAQGKPSRAYAQQNIFRLPVPSAQIMIDHVNTMSTTEMSEMVMRSSRKNMAVSKPKVPLFCSHQNSWVS